MSKKWKRRMGALLPITWAMVCIAISAMGYTMPVGLYIVGIMIAMCAGVALGL